MKARITRELIRKARREYKEGFAMNCKTCVVSQAIKKHLGARDVTTYTYYGQFTLEGEVRATHFDLTPMGKTIVMIYDKGSSIEKTYKIIRDLTKGKAVELLTIRQ